MSADVMDAPAPDPDASEAPAFTEADLAAFSKELDGLGEQPEFMGHHLIHRPSGLFVDFRTVIGVVPSPKGYAELILDGLPYSVVTPFGATSILNLLLLEHEAHMDAEHGGLHNEA